MLLKIVLVTWMIAHICSSQVDVTLPDTLNEEIDSVSHEAFIHDSLQDEDTHQREPLKRLSKLFGISRIPKNFKKNNRPPEYMVNLFNTVAYEDGVTKTPAPYDANKVQGLPDRASREQLVYQFDLSHAEQIDEILGAEFHVFKVIPHRHDKRQSRHVVILELYQILPSSNDSDKTQNRILLHRRLISAHSKGWEVFNVTQTVQQWILDKNSNLGFMIQTSAFLHVEDRDIESHFVFAQKGEHHDSKQPLLVLFSSSDNRIINYDSIPREQGKRSENDPKLKSNELHGNNAERNSMYSNSSNLAQLRENYIWQMNEGQRKNDAMPLFSPRRVHQHVEYMDENLHNYLSNISTHFTSYNNNRREKRDIQDNKVHRRRKKNCSLHELYVDFKEIGWSSWIISPKGYNAFHCKGSCQFPLGQHQQPTNHATVQSIVAAFRKSKEVNSPCCVPNKLYSVSLLYFDEKGNVILKQYDDMVVAGCGCH